MARTVFGLVGWSGSGKTTLMSDLLPELIGRGLTVSTIKHTHHDIEIDKPGKDSYRHRESGAAEVVITSPLRWALVHELRGAPEPEMETLVERMQPVDLILVEGFRRHRFPKLEIHRPATGQSLQADTDPTIVAVATDGPMPETRLPVLPLSDIGAIADFVIDCCRLTSALSHDTPA